MRTRLSLFALIALVGWPAASSAGPIEFSLSPGNITNSPWAPALGMALVPIQPPGPVYTFDPAANTPVTVGVVAYEPQRISTPAPRDIHPDGTTHWNNDGYFGIDVGLIDFASGEVATLHFSGRAHMYNFYSTQGGWTGTTDFWFQDYAHVTLGGNEYTVWGANWFDTGPVALDVWVGPNPPLHLAPEPGTLLLGALALAPLTLRRLRRKRD
jgi:hypothetical protein